MTGYKKHGLSQVEDYMLSKIEVESGRKSKRFVLPAYTPEQRQALRSLEAQGLIELRVDVGEDFYVRWIDVTLTPEGLALWHARAMEEA